MGKMEGKWTPNIKTVMGVQCFHRYLRIMVRTRVKAEIGRSDERPH